MLYLDLMTQDGGQVYLDICAVEVLKRRSATGFAVQGVLGDGYREAQVLVEYVDAEVSLTFIDGGWHDLDTFDADITDLPETLRRALKDELDGAGVWVDMQAGGGSNSGHCSLLAGDHWHGAAVDDASGAETSSLLAREAATGWTPCETDRFDRCFLSKPAVKQVQTHSRSLHAHSHSCLNQPVSSAAHAPAGTALSGRGADLQGVA